MSSVNFPLTFSLAPIPTGEALDANAYGQQLVANLQAFISGNFLTGQIGGTQPTQDVGPWLNGNNWWFWDPTLLTYVPQSISSSLPTGSIIAFGGIAAPSGYLLCDGSSYLISNQLALFGVIGTSYGNTGGGTFRVPDYRGRVIMGAGSGPGLTIRSIGNAPGTETVALAAFNHAAHTHTITDQQHQHSMTPALTATTQGLQAGGATYFLPGTASTTFSFTGITTTNSSGSGIAHANIQPSLVSSCIIKT